MPIADASSAPAWRTAATSLLQEAFFGPPEGTAWGDFTTGPHTGLVDTLASSTPRLASAHVAPGRPAIAGHLRHVLLSIDSEAAAQTGTALEPDWAAAWQAAVNDEAAQTQLAGELDAAVARATALCASADPADPEAVRRALALVAHTAYHLGAVRQLWALLTSPPPRHALVMAAFTDFDRALSGLAPEEATQRLPGAPYSIAEVLAHCAFWQDFMLDRVAGLHPQEPAHAEEGWPPVEAHAFDNLRTHFLTRLEAARSLAKDHVRLLEALPADSGRTVEEELNDLAVHNAHHLGQIILLRRMAGLWPPPGGGDTW